MLIDGPAFASALPVGGSALSWSGQRFGEEPLLPQAGGGAVVDRVTLSAEASGLSQMAAGGFSSPQEQQPRHFSPRRIEPAQVKQQREVTNYTFVKAAGVAQAAQGLHDAKAQEVPLEEAVAQGALESPTADRGTLRLGEGFLRDGYATPLDMVEGEKAIVHLSASSTAVASAYAARESSQPPPAIVRVI